MKRLFAISLLLMTCHMAAGQGRIVDDFKSVCDSLSVLIKERCSVDGRLRLKNVMKRGGALDFYFTESLGDLPWAGSDVKWLRSTLRSLFPEKYSRYRLGEIYSRRDGIDSFVTPALTFDGKPSESRYRVKTGSRHSPLVCEIGRQDYSKGLSGRHIALWQSHGRYYSHASGQWEWQRPCLFQTCEDMFTQGFVLPYLVPMLENSGAYVLMPRERDIQKNEVVADNDGNPGWRGKAAYAETGRWEDAGTGFADKKAVYEGCDSPFTMGTARKSSCVGPAVRPTASVRWTPEIPRRGEYAVYVSYKTLPNSTSAAHYTVRHLGGISEFAVNQKIGGGTWVYLGTFEFDKGTEGCVTLDNAVPDGYRLEVGGTVTADAVRFGGGMGNIARSTGCPTDKTAAPPAVSGLPRYVEGARYWLQWAGADSTVYSQNDGRDDYKDDFMSRGDWVASLDIPVDLSFGFHSDAGVTPNDSIVGTLVIYTSRSEGKTKLPSGESRMTSRMYADMVQSQIIRDLRHSYDTSWTRRSIWDRAYRESRTPTSPAMLLELLSHQNFADMKYGLDPSFRFDVSRAIYKGMLKYLSSRFGQPYTVQPLPVESMAVKFKSKNSVNGSRRAVVSWKPVSDSLEPTADPCGYILYTRIGDGAFDNGRIIKAARTEGGRLQTEVSIEPDCIYSYRIEAYNDGGKSFPSETVSIGYPSSATSENTVLIVNNFDRVSGPAFFEDGSVAGFDNRLDGGVPDRRDITFIGEMYDFRRQNQWLSNQRPGFGASYSDMAGDVIAGNTFDYPSMHGKAVLEAGYPFCSCSNERFCSDTLMRTGIWAVDLICGKQVRVPSGLKQKYAVFPSELQSSLQDFTSKGGHIITSGAYIGTDICDMVYPVRIDSLGREQAIRFAADVLGYRFVTNQASRRGHIKPVSTPSLHGHLPLKIVTDRNPYIYCVESPDGIAPSCSKGKIIYRYTDSGIPAGVAYDGEGYRCVSLGFPIETLEDSAQISGLLETILEYFEK